MNDLLIKLLNMSLTASLSAAAVMLVRLIFRKMPKKIGVCLWALVALRLVLPFSIQSPVSLVPDNEPLRQEAFGLSSPTVPAAVSADEWTTVGVSGEYNETYPTVPVDSDGTPMGKKPFPVLPVVWISGAGAMLLYAAASYLSLKRKTGASMETEKGVYLCDDIATPFILGIIQPKIYIPSSLNEAQRTFVLSHEKAHIKRLDFLWKPFGFLLLSVYWFNPVLWLAYILLCRDIELACDEKVIENMQISEKADYSQTLLDCSLPKRSIAVCPLAFGETGVKTRVKNILHFKKPAFWVILIAVLVCAALAVFFLTDPVKDENVPEPTTNGFLAREYTSGDFSEVPESKSTLEEAIHEVLLKMNANRYSGECLTEGHVTLGTDKTGDSVKAYLLTHVTSYGFENGYFTNMGGSLVPTVLVFREENGMYIFEECIEAEDGGRYADSIREMYPLKYRSRVLGEWSEADNKAMIEQCRAQAQAYLDTIGRAEEIRSWRDVPHKLLTDVGISVEIQEKIFDAMSYIPHYDYLGFEECVENGIRYTYRTIYDEKTKTVCFSKINYESGAIQYAYSFAAETGEERHPENVTFAGSVNTAQINAKDTFKIAEGLAEKLKEYPCAEGEQWFAVINKAEPVPLGMVGLFDGVNVYDVSCTVFPGKENADNESASDAGTEKKEVNEYVFIYFSESTRTFAGAMTYDEIKEAYGDASISGNDEDLLRMAAADVIRGFAVEPQTTDGAEGSISISKGVEVYVWKMAENHYQFALLPGTNREKTSEELAALSGVSAEEMKEHLRELGASEGDVFLIPIQHPLSSYLWLTSDGEFIDGETEESLREMLELN